MDWDSEQNWSTRFWARVVVEKKERQREFQIIKRERYQLEGERRQIVQMRSDIELQKRDLQVRRNKIREEDELLIPFAKSLTSCGATTE